MTMHAWWLWAGLAMAYVGLMAFGVRHLWPRRERVVARRRFHVAVATIWYHRRAWITLAIGTPLAMAAAYYVAIERLQLAAVPAGKADADIDWHLRGARLVPPPPLPPETFVTADRPHLQGADRDWAKLDPVFRDRVLMLLARLAARGYPMALLEGYRSPERQDLLAGLGGHVTLARAFQSAHQFGLAVDLAPLRAGKLVIDESDPEAMTAYAALGEEAERLGLVWGGRWAMRDYGHVEAARPTR
jgi:peptidoglycan LD-endopeptidase CwlK